MSSDLCGMEMLPGGESGNTNDRLRTLLPIIKKAYEQAEKDFDSVIPGECSGQKRKREQDSIHQGYGYAEILSRHTGVPISPLSSVCARVQKGCGSAFSSGQKRGFLQGEVGNIFERQYCDARNQQWLDKHPFTIEDLPNEKEFQKIIDDELRRELSLKNKETLIAEQAQLLTKIKDLDGQKLDLDNWYQELKRSRDANFFTKASFIESIGHVAEQLQLEHKQLKRYQDALAALKETEEPSHLDNDRVLFKVTAAQKPDATNYFNWSGFLGSPAPAAAASTGMTPGMNQLGITLPNSGVKMDAKSSVDPTVLFDWSSLYPSSATPAKPMQTTGLIPGMSNQQMQSASVFGGLFAQSAGAQLAKKISPVGAQFATTKENTPPRANGSSGKRVKFAPESSQPDLQDVRVALEF